MSAEPDVMEIARNMAQSPDNWPPLRVKAVAEALIAAQARNAEVVAELTKLCRAYVSLLELGRNRILDLGGTCDAVDVMEGGDPALASARATIGKAGG